MLISHLSRPKYRADIDGLRALAVLSVVVFHAFPDYLPGGFIGVDVFFVISGFLISTILFENLQKGSLVFSEFYARRIKRIFPALITVLIACLGVGFLCLLPDELNQLGKHVAAGAGFISNFILWGESGYFDHASESKPLLHLWSLGIEEQFYIVWPFLLALAHKLRLNLFKFTLFFLGSSFLLNIWMVNQYPTATFYAPFTRMWELLFGAALSWVILNKSNLFSRLGPGIKNALPLFGLALFTWGIFFMSKELSFPGVWALLPVLSAVCVITGGSEAWINRSLLSNKILVWFGLISFPLYLWHWPVLSFGHILYFDTPPLKYRVLAVIFSIFLAWITLKWIENPIRFGTRYTALKVRGLCGVLLVVGVVGLVIFTSNFSKSRTFETLILKRKQEYAIGSSLSWYRGKEDWLFLGDHFDHTVAKLKLSKLPPEKNIAKLKERLDKIAETGAKYGIKTILIMGPNKCSIYPEYLPETVTPSAIKYSSFFLKKLKENPNLIVYDPTQDLLAAKKTEGFLYWMTDTHWNAKGAFIAYSGFTKVAHLPLPDIRFTSGPAHPGDLIGIAKLKNFPLHAEDNWEIIWKNPPRWTEKRNPYSRETEFGTPSLVTNTQALSSAYVWVVGDSFSTGLKPYFNATFRHVRYVGHLKHTLKKLPRQIQEAKIKPDMIILIKAERTF